ncbi:hypothetical protein GPJ56_010105 [Histomonas meleagridis]|uniref:uncharacterized protein n=1 Tax=Histomonas meleagridis TaxID=135588 RepID=UPI003559B763|nr:hypothetical protein GPJ56_010105 [Histomonas meleagridis]KAH0806761.1 hypothetical protein GO595_000404 [Histomonas meleagridis]
MGIYCTVSDAEHIEKVQHQPNMLMQESISQLDSFPDIKPFEKSGKYYFPVHVQVPKSLANKFVVSVFILNNPQFVATKHFWSYRPFTVTYNLFTTSQSIIFQIKVHCKLPQQFKNPVPVLSADLRFDSSFCDELMYSSSIAIIKTATGPQLLSDGDAISYCFCLKPLNDFGTQHINQLYLVFSLAFSIENKEYTLHYPINCLGKASDLLINAPMMKYKLMKPSSLQLRVTNLSDNVRNIKICFGTGNIQPVTKQCEMLLEKDEKTKIVDFKFIPLRVGYHLLDIWVEENEKKRKPLFPIYLSVEE